MKIAHPYRKQSLDITALLGMTLGMALTLPAALMPELALLALPGFVVLVPSLLYGLR